MRHKYIYYFPDVLCKIAECDKTSSKDHKKFSTRSTIFDSRVLEKVKSLFSDNVQTRAKITSQTGQKKSIIAAADVEQALRIKIDPRQFGNALLNQANENAARKSDIYMNKAIDATALGVAVLKLIFGKDAKMVMKDAKSDDTQASLRASEPRPKITSWRPDTSETAKRKTLKDELKGKSKGSDKIGKLSMNILNLVKDLQPSNGERTTETDETVSPKDSLGAENLYDDKENSFKGSESNLERLLSLMEDSKAKAKTGDKKSWVLLKVPSKQPKDELGMLTDPAAAEDNSDDESSQHEHAGEKHDVAGKVLHKKKESHSKESSKTLITKIKYQVKHLADMVSKQKGDEKEESFTESKHHKRPETTHQSYEGKSFRPSMRIRSKTLKSEPFQEVNAVKTDTKSYENSVKNLLKALETSAHKHSLTQESRHKKKGRRGHRKIDLVPVKTKEEHASSKDVVGGTNPAGQ